MGKAVSIRHADGVGALDAAGNLKRRIDDRDLTRCRGGRNRRRRSGWLGHGSFPFQNFCRADSRAGKCDPRISTGLEPHLRAFVAFLNSWRCRPRMLSKKWRKNQRSRDSNTDRTPRRGHADHVTVRVPRIVE